MQGRSKAGRRKNTPRMIPAAYAERIAERFVWDAFNTLRERNGRVEGDGYEVARALNLGDTPMAIIVDNLLPHWRTKGGGPLPPLGAVGVPESDMLRLPPIPVTIWDIDDMPDFRTRQLESIIRQVTDAYDQFYDGHTRKAVIRETYYLTLDHKIHAAVLSTCFRIPYGEIELAVRIEDVRTIKAGVAEVSAILEEYLKPLPGAR